MKPVWILLGFSFFGCSSREVVRESTDAGVSPPPTFEPDAAVHSAFTCVTPAPTTTGPAHDAGASAPGQGPSPTRPDETSPVPTPALGDAGSETSGGCNGMPTGGSSPDTVTSARTAGETTTPNPSTNSTSSVESGSTSQPSPSSDPTSSDDNGSTSQPCVPPTTVGSTDFECGDACATKVEPCRCYVEKACLAGDKDCSGVAVWSLTVDQAEFDDMNENYRKDMRIEGTLCADSELYDMTLEVQGASSRKWPKKNYNLRFDKDNELPGVYLGAEGTIDKLVVKAMATDRTLIRETLGFDLWRAMGHDAPYSGGTDGYVQLLVNGQFHGVYARVEPVDKDYLRRRGMPDDGRLYKGVRKNGGFADFRPERIIEDAFEDKTSPDNPSYEVLQELLDVIQDEKLSPEEFVTEIGRYISIDQFIDRIVWVSFTQNGDAVAQNFFLYYRSGMQPPWHLIPWDSNLCFGADWADPENFLSPNGAFMFDGRNLLAERLLEHPPIASAFKDRYAELLGSVFSSDALSARFWPLVDYLGVAMDRDRARWGYATDAATAFEALAEFLDARPAAVESRLFD